MEILDKYPFFIFVLRIMLAGVCGFAIGLERYMSQKSAGVRTHTVVCCASALFMLVSIPIMATLSATEQGQAAIRPSISTASRT